MTRVVVDTDVVSFIFKSHPIGAIYEADLAGCTLMISFMTLAELDSPAVQFRQSHEGDHQGTPGEVGFVDGADGMALENERDDVGIDDDTSHAAGSTLLVWPRHSWSAARNSSIDSSSGQKSPCKTDRSVIGPLPCWAISSSTLGLASKL